MRHKNEEEGHLHGLSDADVFSLRDYGDEAKAAECAADCASLGFEAVSMRDEFETIYGEEIKVTAEMKPAA